MATLEESIAAIREQLAEAERQKAISREEARAAKLQEERIAKELEEVRSPEKRASLGAVETSEPAPSVSPFDEAAVRKEVAAEMEEQFS